MDVLSLIDRELRDKHLNDFEKVRYIYLRTCELFYFDTRYHFKEYISKRKISKIVNKKIDLEGVDDFRIICHTYSEHVLKKLINEFTNMDVKLRPGGHSYLVLKDNEGRTWNLDATLGDLSRVKIGTKTTGFNCIWRVKDSYVDDIDKELGYNFKERNDFFRKIDYSSFEIFIESINNLINDNNKLNDFSDSLFFVKWLLNGCFCIFSDCMGMDKSYNFYDFIFDEASGDLFCLSKDFDKYNISKISYDEGLQLSKKLYMNNRSFFNKNK